MLALLKYNNITHVIDSFYFGQYINSTKIALKRGSRNKKISAFDLRQPIALRNRKIQRPSTATAIPKYPGLKYF